MKRHLSLRARLVLIILCPLLLIAVGVGYLAFRDAELRAADRFDRSLLSTALGISRDTGLSGGDALSEETRDLLRDTSGGPVFYHAYAPDGVFVTGYATPPVPPEQAADQSERYIYFDAIYHDRPVRVLRLQDHMNVDGLGGEFTFTVWQDTALRDGFVQSLSQRTFSVMATLVAALALIVWFGVRIGLRPLLDLEYAIARRSSEDLGPIQRAIPAEVQGIVGRLNTLLAELSQTLRAKDDFISDAAHQLRNPISGVLALSEAVAAAPNFAAAQERSRDLVEASRHAAKLTEDMLTFERAKSPKPIENLTPVDVFALARSVVSSMAKDAEAARVTLTSVVPNDPALVRIDPLLLEQAMINLISNAIAHGGPTLSRIEVSAEVSPKEVSLSVRDNGSGISQAQHAHAMSRFGQVSPSTGSGLGLPIAKATAEGAGGALSLEGGGTGLTVMMTLPLANA